MFQHETLCAMKILCLVEGHNLIIILLFTSPIIKYCPFLWTAVLKVFGTEGGSLGTEEVHYSRCGRFQEGQICASGVTLSQEMDIFSHIRGGGNRNCLDGHSWVCSYWGLSKAMMTLSNLSLKTKILLVWPR